MVVEAVIASSVVMVVVGRGSGGGGRGFSLCRNGGDGVDFRGGCGGDCGSD
ncbi:hypothetical protein BVC80_7267g3 [Macleaya cordata]|uniref:Uncharacterized protein n=1 Tax=Macleaya cordata TaxID=56857 RepID=A0A200PMF4_MACCD|nr:hypothetical protein BVC80_7267g3 [Macleaya cordata]